MMSLLNKQEDHPAASYMNDANEQNVAGLSTTD